MTRRRVGPNLWFDHALESRLSRSPTYELHPEIIESEEAVGSVMLAELESLARSKIGDLVIILLGGRGAQAFHRLLGEKARAGDPDGLIARLCVFTL
jgi:hypothetical protein